MDLLSHADDARFAAIAVELEGASRKQGDAKWISQLLVSGKLAGRAIEVQRALIAALRPRAAGLPPAVVGGVLRRAAAAAHGPDALRAAALLLGPLDTHSLPPDLVTEENWAAVLDIFADAPQGGKAELLCALLRGNIRFLFASADRKELQLLWTLRAARIAADDFTLPLFVPSQLSARAARFNAFAARLLETTDDPKDDALAEVTPQRWWRVLAGASVNRMPESGSAAATRQWLWRHATHADQAEHLRALLVLLGDRADADERLYDTEETLCRAHDVSLPADLETAVALLRGTDTSGVKLGFAHFAVLLHALREPQGRRSREVIQKLIPRVAMECGSAVGRAVVEQWLAALWTAEGGEEDGGGGGGPHAALADAALRGLSAIGFATVRPHLARWVEARGERSQRRVASRFAAADRARETTVLELICGFAPQHVADCLVLLKRLLGAHNLAEGTASAALRCVCALCERHAGRLDAAVLWEHFFAPQTAEGPAVLEFARLVGEQTRGAEAESTQRFRAQVLGVVLQRAATVNETADRATLMRALGAFSLAELSPAFSRDALLALAWSLPQDQPLLHGWIRDEIRDMGRALFKATDAASVKRQFAAAAAPKRALAKSGGMPALDPLLVAQNVGMPALAPHLVAQNADMPALAPLLDSFRVLTRDAVSRGDNSGGIQTAILLSSIAVNTEDWLDDARLLFVLDSARSAEGGDVYRCMKRYWAARLAAAASEHTKEAAAQRLRECIADPHARPTRRRNAEFCALALARVLQKQQKTTDRVLPELIEFLRERCAPSTVLFKVLLAAGRPIDPPLLLSFGGARQLGEALQCATRFCPQDAELCATLLQWLRDGFAEAPDDAEWAEAFAAHAMRECAEDRAVFVGAVNRMRDAARGEQSASAPLLAAAGALAARGTLIFAKERAPMIRQLLAKVQSQLLGSERYEEALALQRHADTLAAASEAEHAALWTLLHEHERAELAVARYFAGLRASAGVLNLRNLAKFCFFQVADMDDCVKAAAHAVLPRLAVRLAKHAAAAAAAAAADNSVKESQPQRSAAAGPPDYSRLSKENSVLRPCFDALLQGTDALQAAQIWRSLAYVEQRLPVVDWTEALRRSVLALGQREALAFVAEHASLSAGADGLLAELLETALAWDPPLTGDELQNVLVAMDNWASRLHGELEGGAATHRFLQVSDACFALALRTGRAEMVFHFWSRLELPSGPAVAEHVSRRVQAARAEELPFELAAALDRRWDLSSIKDGSVADDAAVGARVLVARALRNGSPSEEAEGRVRAAVRALLQLSQDQLASLPLALLRETDGYLVVILEEAIRLDDAAPLLALPSLIALPRRSAAVRHICEALHRDREAGLGDRLARYLLEARRIALAKATGEQSVLHEDWATVIELVA